MPKNNIDFNDTRNEMFTYQEQEHVMLRRKDSTVQQQLEPNIANFDDGLAPTIHPGINVSQSIYSE